MFLDRFFKRRVALVEVPAARPIAKLDDELADHLRVLPHNAAFKWLTDRLELQSRYLASKLANEPHGSLREVDQLQAGIYWCHWLQRQVADVTNVPQRKLRDPEAEELELFKQLSAQLERVGSDPTAVDTP